MIARAASILVLRAKLFLLLGILISMTMIIGLKNVTLDNRERSFFPSDDPIIENSDWLSERMGNSKDTMLLLYQPENNDILEPFSLSQLRTITDEAVILPYVTDTHSFFDDNKLVRVTNPQRDTEKLAVIPSLQGNDIFSPEGIEVLRDDLRFAPTIIRRSIANDFASAAITLQVDLDTPLKDDDLSRNQRIDELKSAVQNIETLLQRDEPKAQLSLVGSTLFEYASTNVLREDVRQFFPIFIVLFFITMLLFYRSWLFSFLALIFVGTVISSTAGAIAWTGLPFSTLSTSGLLLVGTLAVADMIHLANGYFPNIAEQDNRKAIENSLHRYLFPIIATSATTIIGASALYFSPSGPISVLATVIIVGVMMALIMTFLFIPSILILCKRKELKSHTTLVYAIQSMSRIARRKEKTSIIVAALICLIALSGLPKMQVDDDLSGWFSAKTEFRQGMDLLDEQYLSLRTISLATRLEDKDRDLALNYQGKTDLGYYSLLQEKLSAQTDGNWLSIDTARSQWLQRLDQGENTGYRPDRELLAANLTTPSSRTLADSGLLTRLEPGNSDWVVSYFDPRNATTFELLNQISNIEREIADLPGSADRKTTIQGIPYAFAKISSENFFAVALGSVIAIVFISISMWFVFRSFRLAMISLIPNIFPLLVVYGVLGWTTGNLNMAAVGVFATAFGIIVDDTIHFVSAFKRERLNGYSNDDALDRAISSSGSAIVITTIILSAGFLLLSLSNFNLTAQKAGMVGAAIIIAIIFDLLVLPILLKFSRFRAA